MSFLDATSMGYGFLLVQRRGQSEFWLQRHGEMLIIGEVRLSTAHRFHPLGGLRFLKAAETKHNNDAQLVLLPKTVSFMQGNVPADVL